MSRDISRDGFKTSLQPFFKYQFSFRKSKTKKFEYTSCLELVTRLDMTLEINLVKKPRKRLAWFVFKYTNRNQMRSGSVSHFPFNCYLFRKTHMRNLVGIFIPNFQKSSSLKIANIFFRNKITNVDIVYFNSNKVIHSSINL